MQQIIMISAMFVLAGLGFGIAGGRLPDSGDDPPSGDRSLERRQMVAFQIAGRGVDDPQVLDVMRTMPRHRFVPEALSEQAYDDAPLPIGYGQTISQPYIVGFMTEALRIAPEHRVLEIGTGSGYQAAILAELASEVYTIEIVPELGERAGQILAELGYDNISVRIGDGYRGWPEAAGFDRIMLTAAPETIPHTLLDQLRDGGILIAPVGPTYGVQELIRITKYGEELRRERLLGVRFVPMVPGP